MQITVKFAVMVADDIVDLHTASTRGTFMPCTAIYQQAEDYHAAAMQHQLNCYELEGGSMTDHATSGHIFA